MTAGGPARSERADARRDGLLPPEHPLSMPDQCLARRSDGGHYATRDRLTWTRAAILAAWLVLTAAFAERLHAVVAVPAMTPLQAVFLVLSVLSFAWVAFGTVLFVAGFVGRLVGQPGNTIELPPAGPVPDGRTALLFPVYHEDMAEIAATIEALATDADWPLIAGRCDVFILSDSRTEDAEHIEIAAATLLRRHLNDRVTVYYRRRAENVDRKSGNIRDWITHFGGAYETFVVFDADSRMTVRALAVLIRAMAEHPRAGLIQTVPRLETGPTLLTRLAAYAASVQGPIAATGLALWTRDAGNYWGHNAIVRTHVFAAAAGLPRLSGSPPFGGVILSHDFVEAALLRRAGFEVHLVAGLDGTSEGSPPRLLDLMTRDRRWAQGNVQHLRLLTIKGLPWISRLHLALGAAAYLASACWAATLAVGMVLAIQARLFVPTYFGSEPSLFPLWPRFDPEAALPLFGWTMAVVFLPKVLSLVATLLTARTGRGRLIGGALVETVASALIAPMLMAAQTRAVIEVLARRDSGWGAQRRAGEAPTFADALSSHWGSAVIGIAILAAGALISGWLAVWLLPIGLGLALAPAIGWMTARPAPDWLARWLAPSQDTQTAGPDDWSAYRQDARVLRWRAMIKVSNDTGVG